MISALQHLDYILVQKAANWSSASDWHYYLVYFCAEVLIMVFPLYLFYLWSTADKKGSRMGHKKTVLLAIMVVVLALAIKSGINYLYARPRPFVTHPDILSMYIKVDSASFPSSHTMMAFAIAFSLRMSKHRKMGNWLLLLAALVALGRIFAGVHYPSDILGGIIIAYFVSLYLHQEASTLKRYLPEY